MDPNTFDTFAIPIGIIILIIMLLLYILMFVKAIFKSKKNKKHTYSAIKKFSISKLPRETNFNFSWHRNISLSTVIIILCLCFWIIPFFLIPFYIYAMISEYLYANPDIALDQQYIYLLLPKKETPIYVLDRSELYLKYSDKKRKKGRIFIKNYNKSGKMSVVGNRRIYKLLKEVIHEKI